MSIWQPPTLHAWCNALAEGHPVAAPAEGLYGYGADPFNPHAVARLLALKQRTTAKGVITLLPSPDFLTDFCPPLPPACQDAVNKYWPCPQDAPVTLILPAKGGLPPELMGAYPGTVALRCPATPYMQEYLAAWTKRGRGPLISTSANITGQPPATDARQLNPTIPALTLPHALSGHASRIFNPLRGEWYR